MTGPAHEWTTHDAAFEDAGQTYGSEDFFPGERIGASRTSGSKAKRGAILFSIIALGGAYAWFGQPAALMSWAGDAVTAARQRNSPAPAEPPLVRDAAAAAASAPQPLASSVIPDAPAAAQLERAPQPPAAPAAAATPDGETAASPLPPPVVDPADPFQKRAVAVGLHPDLSRVLLAKLSTADYRNAGIAIKTAMAKTPDSDVFVYPRQRLPELALFEVHFVPGAAPDCRRYVVTVTKDRWLTTALPMEKCGAEAGKIKRG